MYMDLADAIIGRERDGLPTAQDGLRSMAAVYAAVCPQSRMVYGLMLNLQFLVVKINFRTEAS